MAPASECRHESSGLPPAPRHLVFTMHMLPHTSAHASALLLVWSTRRHALPRGRSGQRDAAPRRALQPRHQPLPRAQGTPHAASCSLTLQPTGVGPAPVAACLYWDRPLPLQNDVNTPSFPALPALSCAPLQNESTGTKTFTLFGPAGGGTNLTAFHFETKVGRAVGGCRWS